MSDVFDPKKIIDFSKDYYAILNLSKNELPFGSDRKSKIELTNKLDQSFRKMARVCHPDFGGSKEAFLDIVRARRIIEDPILRKIYDQGEFTEVIQNSESNSGFEVDWTKIGTYRKGTTEDTVGYSLFLGLCERKTELDIIPAFIPDNNEHNYEWDFVINNGEQKSKLVISIVNDENEVLRLSNSADVESALPFKIYICIPKASLCFVRDNNQVVSPNGNILTNANITKVLYNDQNLLETTNLQSAHDYLDNVLREDLDLYSKGQLNKLSKNLANVTETKWMDSEKLKDFDKSQLNQIFNVRKFETQNDEKAADFLENIDQRKIKKVVSDKPDLPF
jgi:hypothetical protein